MNTPLISVIIPIYNVEQYLLKCLDSVIGQTYKNIEIICVNDGSTDDSISILNEYTKNDSRIKIINKENQGVSAARNIGVDNATGGYILFVDADDTLNLSAVEKTVNIIDEHPESDVVLFDYINVYQKTTYPITRIKKFVEQNQANLFKLENYPGIAYLTNSIWHQLFKKDFLVKHNIKFNETLTHSEDLLYWITVLLNGAKIYLLPENLYYYNRTVENSASGKSDNAILSSISALNIFTASDIYKNSLKTVQKTLVAAFLLTILNNWYLVNNKLKYDRTLNNLLQEYKYPLFFNHFSRYKGAYFMRYRYLYFIIKRIVMKIITSTKRGK